MTRQPPEIPQDAFDAALTFLIGWRSGRRIRGSQVNVAGDAANELRQVCRRTVDQLANMDRRQYDPDGLLEGNDYFVVPAEAIDADTDTNLILEAAGELDLIGPDELARKSVAFYAVILGDDPAERIAFVRKANPRSGLRPGRIWTTFREALTRIDTPDLVLDEFFDLVIDSTGIVILDQRAFELLFRDTPAVQERVPEWVAAIGGALPLAEDGAERLAERCNRDLRLRKRVRNIYERGHLRHVTIDDVRTAINDLGLEEDALIRDDQLVFDEADPLVLARLLNEDLFRGTFTEARFQADGKTPI